VLVYLHAWLHTNLRSRRLCSDGKSETGSFTGQEDPVRRIIAWTWVGSCARVFYDLFVFYVRLVFMCLMLQILRLQRLSFVFLCAHLPISLIKDWQEKVEFDFYLLVSFYMMYM
jgi:hypothetical protein